MRRPIHTLIRIVGGFVLVWFSVAAFHSARQRDLPTLCVEIGFLLSGVPYVVYPGRSPFYTMEKKCWRRHSFAEPGSETFRAPGSAFHLNGRRIGDFLWSCSGPLCLRAFR